mmetsp:Transcript_24077/g.36570  ORF Transcript_24077/g.36570 Transcript_24077/m.36570 type:complete len:345 (-) Transcript_24077:208-1242(-)
MKYEFRSFITHVAGTCMIAQGDDGLSRSDLNAGVLAGKNMLEFLPLHQGALERFPALEKWVRTWCGNDTITLSPEDWFVRGHNIVGFERDVEDLFDVLVIKAGTFLWSSPPWAALPCLEELRKARIKRHKSLHIVLISKLAKLMWQKMLYKLSDVVLDLPANLPFWSESMHEHLLIGLLFPYIRYDPWCLRGTPKMYQLRWEVQKECLKTLHWPRGLFCTNFAWSLGGSHSCRGAWCGSCYTYAGTHKFFCQYDKREMHEVVGDNGKRLNLWRHKSPDEKQFLEARDGDMLLSPFVCHECIFFILVGQPPNAEFHSDGLLVSVLKRAILDGLYGVGLEAQLDRT